MIRTSLVALLSLCLAVGLVAKEPDSQPQSELETIAVNIMTKAFQVGDYDTVEALFGKLSPEKKKEFLQEAAEMTLSCQSQMTAEALGSTTTVDAVLMAAVQAQPDSLPLAIEQWMEAKQLQTQLLGRLTLSLFEPAVGEKPTALVVHEDAQTCEQAVYVLKNTKAEEVAEIINQYLRRLREVISNHPDSASPHLRSILAREIIVVADVENNSLVISADLQYFHDIMKLIEEIDRSPHEPHELSTAPLVPALVPSAPPVAVAPPGMQPVALPRHDDGFITLNSYGRVYIKGLDASEIIDAITFHLSRIEEGPRVAENQPTWSSEMRSMVALDEPMSDEAKLMIDKWEHFNNNGWSMPHHSIRMHYPNTGRW